MEFHKFLVFPVFFNELVAHLIFGQDVQMLELRDSVKRYVNGGISYSEFRREFITTFLSARSENVAVDAAVIEIESLCADAAEGLPISETDLKGKLADIVRHRDAGNSRSSITIVLCDCDFHFPAWSAISLSTAVSGAPRVIYASEDRPTSVIPSVFINESYLTT